MTDAKSQAVPKQQSFINAFNSEVNSAVLKVTSVNQELIEGGIDPTAVALAGSLCAADITAIMAAESGKGAEVVDFLIDHLTTDMKARAKIAFDLYVKNKSANDVEVSA